MCECSSDVCNLSVQLSQDTAVCVGVCVCVCVCVCEHEKSLPIAQDT